ncbi:hypothetical protein [Candidatus Nitrotoga sp. HW29]|uniref:hypothetical protein n=1 Tax=Candidatus Nitrotoga sp. HW29 TaxID=2886963 RepID=UPI001EF17B89|nr:hypothetical protein [Candidatus Nitrotoga sp. HW29]
MSVATVVTGPQLLLLAIPLVFAMSGLGQPTLISLGLLTSAAVLYPICQSLPATELLKIPLASFSYLIASAWVPGIIFFRAISTRSRLTLLVLPIGIALILDLAAGYWVGPSLFTNPVARVVFALAPAALAGWFTNIQTSDAPLLKWIAIPALVGAAIVALLPHAPISEVVFDEGHGKWETVQASFGPDDFGRSANYTYTQLFQKAGNLVGKSSILVSENQPLPGTDSLLVIKMPAEPLSTEFSSQVAGWVERGGRLLVVADHTDLYDTTQHANTLLAKHFGVSINSDAAYNPIGMPTLATVPKAGGLLGRIDAHGRQFAWQTGASFQRIPAMGVELMTYGPSFAESGDYSRANRFGSFVPELTKRFFNHSAVVAVSHGKGAVAILLDSTPWSNFSIFREQYSQMLRGLVGALEHPMQLFILSGAAIALGVLACLVMVFPSRLMAPVLGFVLGGALSAGLAVGAVSWTSHQDGRDFGLRVAAGPYARLEFLKQILAPGERNYSRIVSAMGKYGLMPLASTPGTEIPILSTAKRWLLIEPSAVQLPKYQDMLDHLRRGGDLAILFSPEQATHPPVLAWLNEWGLFTQRSIGLSIFDGMKSSSGSFLGGRSPVLGREIRVVTAPRGTSLLNAYAADQFLQTYTLRPTKLPRESGLLTIGFAADQFTDDAVGEIWEGIYPSSIGRLRERLLSSVFMGEDRPPLMPATLVRAQRGIVTLPAFMVLENGEQKLTGKFGQPEDDDATTANFRALRDQAGDFIAKHCPATGKLTQCTSRLLGEDMIEWLVSWRTTGDGKLLAIELLHERRMSGLGSTWNVLYGK